MCHCPVVHCLGYCWFPAIVIASWYERLLDQNTHIIIIGEPSPM